MSTHEDVLTRIATILATVMNVSSLLANESALQAADPAELRSAFLEIADELVWIGAVVAGGMTQGIAWPSDAPDRIATLRLLASAWDPASPPSTEVLDAARRCVEILQPGGS